MKKPLRRLSVALLFTLIVLSIPVSAAQTNLSIDAFWIKFKTAVIAGNKESASAMVQFPVNMPYGIPAIRTTAQLFKRYRQLFSQQADAAKCFADAKPEIDSTNKNRFTVACKDAAGNEVVIYGFERTKGVWKLKSLDNINE